MEGVRRGSLARSSVARASMDRPGAIRSISTSSTGGAFQQSTFDAARAGIKAMILENKQHAGVPPPPIPHHHSPANPLHSSPPSHAPPSHASLPG